MFTTIRAKLAGDKLEAAVWAVVTACTIATIGWIGAGLIEEWHFEGSLRTRVPTVERKVQILEDAQTTQYQEILRLLRDIRKDTEVVKEEVKK